MTIGISPATSAVNPQTQCTRPGCGTMRLPDGSCPRCDPAMQRTTAEKLALAEAFGDVKLRARADAELDAGIATGIGEHLPRRGVALPGVATNEDVDQLHARVDNLERRIESGFAEILGEMRAKYKPVEITPAVIEPPKP